MRNFLKKNVFRVLFKFVLFFLAVLILSNAENEKTNKIGLTFSLGIERIEQRFAGVNFEFFAPRISLDTKITPDFNLKFRYKWQTSYKYDNNQEYKLNWGDFKITAENKFWNEQNQSIWFLLIYRVSNTQISSLSINRKNLRKEIGIGLAYKNKLNKNLNGEIEVNYYPERDSFRTNLKLEYLLPATKNSIVFTFKDDDLFGIRYKIPIDY